MTIDHTTHGFGEIVATIEHIGGSSVDNGNSSVSMSGVELRLDNVLNARGVPTSGNSIARRSCWADRQMTKSNEQNRRRGSAAQGRLG